MSSNIQDYVAKKVIEHLRYRDEELQTLEKFFTDNSCFVCKQAIGEHQSRELCKSKHLICTLCYNKDKRKNGSDNAYCEACRSHMCMICGPVASHVEIMECRWCGKEVCEKCTIPYTCRLCGSVSSNHIYCSVDCQKEDDEGDYIAKCSAEGCDNEICCCSCLWWKGGLKQNCICEHCVNNLDETKCLKCNGRSPTKKRLLNNTREKENVKVSIPEDYESDGLDMKIKCHYCNVINTLSAECMEMTNTQNFPSCFVCNRPLEIPDHSSLSSHSLSSHSLSSHSLSEIIIPEEYGDVDEATALVISTMLMEEEKEAQKRLEEQESLTMLFLEEEAKQRQLELDNKLYACSICFDELKIEEIYILEDCEHKFCRECIGETCKTQINDGNTRHIKCPEPECDHIMAYQEIRHVVDFETATRYEEFLLKAALSDDPNCVWCIRPGCSMAMIANPDDYSGNMIRCPKDECGFAFCKNCKVEWHADSTCEMYQQWKEEQGDEEARYKAWVKNNAKKCPKCKSEIQKNGGCNHMTCAKCRFEFCWLCLEGYQQGHYSHSDCKQFS